MDNPSGKLLFVTSGLTPSTSRDGPSKAHINSHVQRYKTGKRHPNANGEVAPAAPDAVVMKYKFPQGHLLRRPAHRIPELIQHRPETMLGGFDPFDSLATRNPSGTLEILRRHFPPRHSTGTGNQKSSHHIESIFLSLWDMAMGDSAWYHTMAAGTFFPHRNSGNAISQHLQHRSLALHAMRQALRDEQVSGTMILTVSYHLNFAVDDEDNDAATIHARALQNLSTTVPVEQMHYSLWGIVLGISVKHAMWASCPPAVHPASHPAYDVNQVYTAHVHLDRLARQQAAATMSKIPSFPDPLLDSVIIYNLFRQLFLRFLLQEDKRDSRGAVVLNGNIKQELCTLLAHTKYLREQKTDAESSLTLQAIHCVLLAALLSNSSFSFSWPTSIPFFAEYVLLDRIRSVDDLKHIIREFDVIKWKQCASVESLVWVWYMICAWLIQGRRSHDAESIRLREALDALEVDSVDRMRDILSSFPAIPDANGERTDGVWERAGKRPADVVEIHSS